MKTFIGGMEIKLYGKKELSQIFTNIVQSYLNSGFMIWMSGCTGSQGEEMKIDLSNDNGKTVYRVWMVTEYELIDEKEYITCDTLSIVVKKYDGCCSTLWYSKGETVLERKFYKVSRNHTVYCSSKEEIMEFYNKRETRWEQKTRSNLDIYNGMKELSQKYNSIAIRHTRKMPGYKSLLLKDIKKVFRIKGGYKVQFYNGKACSLIIAK